MIMTVKTSKRKHTTSISDGTCSVCNGLPLTDGEEWISKSLPNSSSNCCDKLIK